VWEHIGASGQFLNWVRHGVLVKFKHGTCPRPFNHGISMLDATQGHLEFLNSELPCFEACGAWEGSHNPRYVSRMFLVPKPGHNQWRLIIDLRELNRYCFVSGRLLCLPRPHQRVLHPWHPGGRHRLLHGQLPRHAVAPCLPPNGLVRLGLLLLQTH
jgi:hypothetical protein